MFAVLVQVSAFTGQLNICTLGHNAFKHTSLRRYKEKLTIDH